MPPTYPNPTSRPEKEWVSLFCVAAVPLPACLSASLIWCRVKLAWGKEGTLSRNRHRAVPSLLLATPIFRDTIFSSQSPPSPPPLSSSSVRSYAVSPSKLLFILAPTKSLFSSLPSMRTCCCPSPRGSFCILLHYKSWASCPSGIFAFNPPYAFLPTRSAILTISFSSPSRFSFALWPPPPPPSDRFEVRPRRLCLSAAASPLVAERASPPSRRTTAVRKNLTD